MQADPDNRPETLTWRPCPCGSLACKRQYPTNLGTFSMGNGFEPHEREWLDKAWAALVASERKSEVA